MTSDQGSTANQIRLLTSRTPALSLAQMQMFSAKAIVAAVVIKVNDAVAGFVC